MVAQSIYTLRKVLGDTGRPSRIVVTRSHSGYGFDVDVTKADVLTPSPSNPVLPVVMPRCLRLSTKKTNPQWADFCEYLTPRVPWTLRCKILTDSVYFRFGFKLLCETRRLFR